MCMVKWISIGMVLSVCNGQDPSQNRGWLTLTLPHAVYAVCIQAKARCHVLLQDDRVESVLHACRARLQAADAIPGHTKGCRFIPTRPPLTALTFVSQGAQAQSSL